MRITELGTALASFVRHCKSAHSNDTVDDSKLYLTLMTKLISVQPASAVISPMPTDVAAWMQSGIN